jgi:60 kDa SS-A/Ro ribonucleoprotein
MSYLSGEISTKITPQSRPIPGQEDRQVKNQAGGYVYGIDKWSMLHRFLILGTEGNTYYATQREQTKGNLDNLRACVAEDGLRTVRVICEISNDGRAPKNDPAILALAVASTLGNDATRKAALDALPTVCRTGTHLFMFAGFRDELGGWGRGVQRAVGNWYMNKEEDDLAYQLIKYRQRGSWTHRDLLRLAKPKTDYVLRLPERAAIRWAVGKDLPEEMLAVLPRRIEGFEKISAPGVTAAQAAKLVQEYDLPREAVPTELLNSVEVWDALLPTMPLTALIRNLATMTRNGLLTPTSEATRTVQEKLADTDRLRKSRVHPMQVLIALRTYAAGHSLRGQNSWVPLPVVIDALDEAFYESFGNVEATGKRRMIALDISGSMWGGMVGGVPGFTPAQASAAMAMVSLKTGDPYEVVAFTSGGRTGSFYSYGGSYGTPPDELIPGLSSMSLSGRQRLDDVERAMQAISRYMGGTDATLPIRYATEQKREVDVFEVYTDNETWAGPEHVSQALRAYRQKSGIDAKLVSVAFTATEYSVADPADPGMLDVVGFDTAAPNLISAFAEGSF